MIRVSAPRLCARRIGWIVGSLLMAWMVALLPSAVLAAQITVDGATCTLPDAIEAANTDVAAGGCRAGSGADTLLLSESIYSLDSGPFDHDGMTATPSVTTTMVISGGVGGAIVERSGADLYRLFHVGDTGDLTLQNITVRYGNVEGEGGAIYHVGALTLLDSDIISNTAQNGGGVYCGDSSMITVTDSSILANTVAPQDDDAAASTTAGAGGGIYGDHLCTLIITNSDVIANTSISGGGIYLSQATMLLTDSDVIANTAELGGGVTVYMGAATITNTHFISNTAGSADDVSGGGGLLIVFGSTAQLTDSALVSNTSQAHGGGLLNVASETTLTNVEIRANRAISSGGGLFLSNYLHDAEQTTTLIGSRLVDNEAGIRGSALEQLGGTTTITQSCIVNNTDPAVNSVINEDDNWWDAIGWASDVDIVGSTITAANNWWGAADGPGGVAPGVGDSVSISVTYSPFLTTALMGCPSSVAKAPPPAPMVTDAVSATATAMPSAPRIQVTVLAPTPTRTPMPTATATPRPMPVSAMTAANVDEVAMQAEVNTGSAADLAISPDGRLVAVATSGRVLILDALTLAEIDEIEASATRLAFSPGGETLATASGTQVSIWRLSDGELLYEFSAHSSAIMDIAFSPDGTIFATASLDQLARLWQVSDGTMLRQYSHFGSVHSLAFSPDGETLATGTTVGAVLWRVSNGRRISVLTLNPNTANSLVFSPDGQTLAAATENGNIWLWREGGHGRWVVLAAHSNAATDIAFTPDSQLFASASADGSVWLWRTSDGAVLHTLSGFVGGVTAVNFLPDGAGLLVATAGGTLQLWALTE